LAFLTTKSVSNEGLIYVSDDVPIRVKQVKASQIAIDVRYMCRSQLKVLPEI
jgi:hypothetical protein